MKNSFTLFGKLIVLYLLVVLLARSPRSYHTLLWTILLCIIWMAIHAILQQHRGYGFGGQVPRWRRDPGVFQSIAFGIFDDPNDLCTVFIIAIPILYAIFRAEKNPIQRTLALAGIPLVGYGAYCTNSRGGVMGVFGMLVAYAIGRTKNKTWRLIMAVFAISFVSVVAPSRFGKGLAGGGRLVPWGDGIAAWKSHPIFGVGDGDFGSYSSEGKVAHNTYIHALTEWGVVGYTPFVLLIYMTVLHIRRAINLKEFVDSKSQIYLSGIFSALVGYLTVIYFLSRQDGHVLYIILGMALAATLIVCNKPEAFQRVFGNARQDLKKGLKFSLGSVAFLYITVKIGYILGVG